MIPKEVNRLLIKFLDEKYVPDFVEKGNLYMQNIEYFRKYESPDISLRGDTNEGLEASLNAKDVIMHLGEHQLNDLVGKVTIRYDHLDKVNVFCMTMISDQMVLDPDNLLYLSKDFKKFGNKAVIIGGDNISVFTARVLNAVKNSEKSIGVHKLQTKKVVYLDKSQSHSKMDVFNKFQEYAWQSEWRIALSQKITEGPFTLSIGSINDIAFVMDTEEFLRTPISLQPMALV